MEKINTPIMAKIEEIKSQIDQLNEELDETHDPESIRNIKDCIETKQHEVYILESILPAERLYMEKAHEKGCMDSMPDGYVITLPDSRNIKQCFEDYFTQTFKSYE